ncbi:MAG TPA: hydantoinase/oxoprolinase N-terminal domain-containing protein, partial [Kofleriaceae bacterium]|nr:hydantoinase/oxoprolinase N-terminal domain-containing protein [Kofleriaceae bacterium]
MTYRLGVDVGGTFTDVALLDETTSAVVTHKVPSVPRDPAAGITRGIREILAAHGVAPAAVHHVAHGTTVSTNALLERRGDVRVGLLTTRGFRDLLEIARQKRPSLYDLRAEKPVPLVPRELRVEVDERVTPKGVLRPLDLHDAECAVRRLAAAGIESLAICLLYSFLEPAHEQQLVDLARRL